jgi:hypothetical protein
MSKRLTQRLLGRYDSGAECLILVYREIIDTSDMRHGHQETLGALSEAVTSDGYDLNYVDEGTFQRVDNGEFVRVVGKPS